MIFRKKHTNILLILLLQVLQCLCATHFVLLVEDSDRDSSLIKTVGASVDRINGDDTLLANQMLYFSTLQSMGNPQVAIEQLADYLNDSFCIIDVGHSGVSEAVASISLYTLVPMITITTTATSYDTVFSTVPSYDLVPRALVEVIDYNEWTEATIISELTAGFLERHTSIGNAFTTANINFESSVRFDLSEDLSSYVQAIFDAEPHIYILNVDERITLRFLCEAYKEQRYYPNYAWITFNSFPNQWWKEYDEYLQQINCTQPDIVVNTVLNRALVLLPYPKSFNSNARDDPLFTLSNYTDDAVTAFVVAMDNCLDICQEESRSDDCLVYCQAQSVDFIASVNFTGITGNVEFNENGSRVSDSVDIYQYQEQGEDGLALELIGRVQNNTFVAADKSIVWPDGVPPDGTPIKIVNILEIWVPILGAFLQSISLSFVIICLSFNIIFRKRKIVKLTSPNLNYIMILGTVGILASGVVFRFTSVTSQTIKCTIDRLGSTWGYDICFAVALVKTVRVFYIFRMKSLKKKVLQDWKLILIIVGIVIIDIIISVPIITVALLNNDIRLQDDPNTESDKNDQGVKQNYCIIVCGTSIYFTLFLAMTVLFKIVLHVIGLVLAFLTRKVEVDALNDAKYSATIIYFSTFILILILITNPVVANNPNLDDAVWTIFVFIMIFMFLGLTFIPKMVALYKDPHGKHAFKPIGVGASNLGKSEESQGNTNLTHLSVRDQSFAPTVMQRETAFNGNSASK